MDALLRAGIAVKPKFAGTVESALGRMLSGRSAATAVGNAIASSYAERQHLAYRVLWSSEDFPPIPIAAHPAVPKEKVEAVRSALLAMADDPAGRKILAASAPLFGRQLPLGFIAVSEAEYEPMHRFYRRRQAPPDSP
jgi:phosphonate transport system substrate-binding protein